MNPNPIREAAILKLYNCKKLKREINRVVHSNKVFANGEYEDDLFQDIMIVFINLDIDLLTVLYNTNKLNNFASRTLYYMTSKTGTAYSKYINESKLNYVVTESSSYFQNTHILSDTQRSLDDFKQDVGEFREDINMAKVKDAITDIFKDGSFKLEDEMLYYWYYIDNMTYQGIENMTGLSDSTVRYRLKNIMISVIKKLKERGIIFNQE